MARKVGAGRRNASPRIFVRTGGECGIAARNETKSRTLFRTSFVPAIGRRAASDGPGEVIHRLAWPQSYP
jgi:hypothetical protein